MEEKHNISPFNKDITFLGGSDSIKTLPVNILPEFAFIGRSNVGKSSIINLICLRNKLARTSHTPGRTSQINLFNVDNQLTLVDLPGYGYAKTSKQNRYNWHNFTQEYLINRPNLLIIYLLIDSRRGIMDIDINFMDMLFLNKLDFQVIYTKCDKQISKDQEKKDCQILSKRYNYSKSIIKTSSKHKYGAKEIQLSIREFTR